MAMPPTDRLVKLEARFTWNGQKVENVLHFQHGVDAPDIANMTSLADVVKASIIADWLPLMVTTVTFREVYVEEYAGGLTQSVTVAGSGTGGVAAESLGGNNALCLSLRTGFAGRSRRGRFYTIGMSEGHQTAGIVTSGYRNGWITAMGNTIQDAADQNWQLVVASFWSGGVARTEGLVSPVTAVIAVDDYVDSQRRRLQGRGQ